MLLNQIVQQASEALLKMEASDKFKDDDATVFIVTQRKIEKMVVDEYTKEAVEKHHADEEADV